MSIGRASLPKLLFRWGARAAVRLRVARILIFLVSWLLVAHRLPWHWFAFSPPAEVLAAEFCGGELPEDAAPPEVAVGERLFLETRFAQFFFANANGDANAILPTGDPVMDTTQTTGESLPGPFAGHLAKNNLPRKPEDESALDYSRRLLTLIQSLPNPQFVIPADGAFQLHTQDFVFGPDALAGLKLFLAEPDETTSQRAGNCIACHMAPNFTDFGFHNTGASQEEYDSIHRQGALVALTIPDLQTRNDNFTLFLPPTAAHPQATGRFRSPPSANKPGFTDLGLWNVFANPGLPNPQEKIAEVLFHAHGRLSEEELLPQTIAVFKTAGPRNLSQSAPYFHTGGKDTFDDVIGFYINMATLVRTGKLRNPDPEIGRTRLTPDDIPLLRAFLQALTEDYS